MVHAKKILPPYFQAVLNQSKLFEVRKNDCDYKVGDYLALNEWDGQKYTGSSLITKITYVLDLNVVFKMPGNYVVLGIQPAGVIDEPVAGAKFWFSQ